MIVTAKPPKEGTLMELILIDDSKLKIMLSAEDMKLYDITCETIDYDDSLSRRAFWDILSEARDRTGFDTGKDKVYVQVYPSKSGGCEMFITKLPPGTDGDESRSECRSGTAKQAKKCVYRFDSLSDMMNACREMKNCGYERCSAAYADGGNGRYYLMTDTEIPLACEFRGRSCRLNSTYYISEHCKKLCDDAVGVLGSL